MTYMQVQLCRVTGEATAPGGAKQRECTQIAQDVTKVRFRFGPTPSH